MALAIVYHLKRIILSIILGIALVALVLVVQAFIGENRGVDRVNDPSILQLDVEIVPTEVIAEINQARIDQGVTPVQHNPAFCTTAQIALNELLTDGAFTSTVELCPGCSKQVIVSLTGTYNEREIITELLSSHAQDLLAPDVNSVCVVAESNSTVISIGSTQGTNNSLNTNTNSTIQPSQQIIYVTPTQPVLREIPDQEVFDALNQYRAVHKVPQLVLNNNLCTYAQKRTQDLVENGGLDAHEGFKRDFENGNVPVGIKEYGGGRIGENLAHQYCYRGVRQVIANTGTALIEWCFDSSTAGHREAQLDPQYTAACVRHQQNMYVVIFGE